MMLAPDIQEKMDALCEEGDRLLGAGDFTAALAAFFKAADLIPDPKDNWEAATWIYSAIGDVYFCQADYTRSLEAFQVAVASPDGLGNPFIHLRLGECQFELGRLDKAADELTRAYMGAGAEIFDGEDAKYFDFLSTRIRMNHDRDAE